MPIVNFLRYCADCDEPFPVTELSPWKYEPEVKLCADCYDARMVEEQEQE